MPRIMLVLLSLVAISMQASADGEELAPLLVTMIETGSSVTVWWAPGSQLAEAYNIYGISVDAPPVLLDTLLMSDPGSAPGAIEVPTGFSTYGVSGVAGESESPMTTASGGPPCIDISPPFVYVNCIPIVTGMPEREIGRWTGMLH